ncbi:hypothetical protein AYI70_g8185 [Smittium culicis]|uniref:Interferon-related developmental regulator N-terminal domain-containing protein n=1 Tax=Smittium culicis TaxID=133412 RepID=A0A1R1XH43_9FUNG|nr:hypothetical protein AYI70_g9486 [Smittium culicis]OMJ13957.1 hypothetical protein AYI70_g8185 [Smittium culicis]
MSQSGNDLLRQALSNYSSSGKAIKFDDQDASNASGSLEIPTGSKSRHHSPSQSRAQSTAQSTAQSRAQSRVQSRAQSRVQSRAQSRSNSREQGEYHADQQDDMSEHELTQAASKLNFEESRRELLKSSGEKLGQFSNDQLSNALSALLDKAGEKRLTTREEGLQGICSIMAHKYIADFEQRNREGYLDTFKKCLRSYKSLKEGLLSARGIALWFLQFGENDDSAYSDIYQFLSKFILDTNSTAIKSQVSHPP